MDLLNIVMENYQAFEEMQIKDRFFKHADLLKILNALKSKPAFNLKEVGCSSMGLSINLITWGKGPKRVFLWTQMHGNEATATMSVADLLNFLSQPGEFGPIHDLLSQKCTLYILPMLNPDGVEVFKRRNAMDIDINRDFLRQQSPEGRVLRSLRDEINPHFGFNLHDQSTLWSAGTTGNPATISFLAPASDESLNVNSTREQAMKVIGIMNSVIQKSISEHIGRFDDEYEPRAFGDNFQAAGTSTILIEAGGHHNDPEKQYIRKIYFKAILSGLICIADESYLKASTENYFSIPQNKSLHFHILLRNCKLKKNGLSYLIDIGLSAVEKVREDKRSVNTIYLVSDLGDLSQYYGYKEIDCKHFTLTQTNLIEIDKPADLVVNYGTNILLSIENGVLTIVNIE